MAESTNVFTDYRPATDWITPRIAAEKYLHVHSKTVRKMCRTGVFKTAHRPGAGNKSAHYLILRSEILQWLCNRHVQAQQDRL